MENHQKLTSNLRISQAQKKLRYSYKTKRLYYKGIKFEIKIAMRTFKSIFNLEKVSRKVYRIGWHLQGAIFLSP